MSDPIEPPGDDDRDAFRRAVAGVRPLPRRPRAATAPRPRPRARFARAEHEDLLRESPALAVDPAAVDRGDELTYSRPGVPPDVLRRLRRGQFAVEAEIDLHGLRREAAHEALRQFLNDSVRHHLHCVRVIHGKGLRSGPAGPVLKHVVNDWLRRFDNVTAFASARPVDGGTGAAYVLLRK